MRSETPPEAINREALLFGLMVGVIATTAMAILGGVPFLLAALGGGVLALVVWFIVVKLGKDLSPPKGPGNLEAVPAPSAAPSEPVAPVAPAPAAPSAAPMAGVKPTAMAAPRDTGADDLKQIKGVGPKLEAMLHENGYFHFDQIAAWSDEEIAWMDDNLEGFKGRVSRDDWVGQAKELGTI